MNVIGIVCEYNPFHNGHKYQIDLIKEKYPDSIIIACMSSSFSQRGNVSIINKFDKTRCALNNGIDIVIELPYIYTVQSADIFAKYSIKLLNYMKIDTLCFGIENNDINYLIKNANIQINNKDYDKLVKKYMNEGNNYPTSLNKALISLGGSNVNEPNELLALSYIKEIIINNYDINLFNIKRTNSYHDNLLNDSVVSASNIRNKLLNNYDIKECVPNDVYTILKNRDISDKFFEYLKYKIITDKDLTKYIDVNEGIDNRIRKYINKSNNLNEFINNIKTKRYTYNKIYRILNHILCSFTSEDFIKDIEYVRILGFTSKGQKYLNNIKKEIDVPFINSYDRKYKALDVEYRVSNIYSIIYEDIMNDEVSNKPIIKCDYKN